MLVAGTVLWVIENQQAAVWRLRVVQAAAVLAALVLCHF